MTILPKLPQWMVFIVTLAPIAAGATAPARVVAMSCRNEASGTSWRIAIDYRRATVNSVPAQIDGEQISWRDPHDGGTYTLDRKSGELTGVWASSTGGYFLHDHCTPH